MVSTSPRRSRRLDFLVGGGRLGINDHAGGFIEKLIPSPIDGVKAPTAMSRAKRRKLDFGMMIIKGFKVIDSFQPRLVANTSDFLVGILGVANRKIDPHLS
jgi:hypothetical protein